MSLDLTTIIEDWPYDPDDEAANVRMIEGDDGLDKVQIRVPNGVLQWEATGRPDGELPFGFESLLDYLQHEVEIGGALEIDAELRQQITEEVMGYYARRVSFFRIGEFDRARQDAEHNLAMMNLLHEHCDDETVTQGHEKWRPFVLMDRTRAIALEDAKHQRYVHALDSIDEGISEIQGVLAERGEEEQSEESDEIRALKDLKFYMRETYDLGLTPKEMLRNLEAEKVEAVLEEDFEAAARLAAEIERIKETYL